MITRSGKLTIAARPATGRSLPALSRSRIRTIARAYLALTKPGIIWLLLVTTVPAMVMAADGWPGTNRVALTLLGGILTAGGANAINQWFDRDIDARMGRTVLRPIPSGLVPPTAALVWGAALSLFGAVQLALTVNWLAAVWALAAVLFYVGVYTMWLKRSTAQNIVIGGAAGSVPPLVGWAAVTESLDVAPALLFLIIFLWTPPHFWALALHYKDEYARVGVPMLPVVRGDAATKRQIVLYAVLLGLASLLLPLSGAVSWLYLGCAAGLGLAFLGQSLRLLCDHTAPMTLFFFSIVYLPLLFLAAMADALVL